MSQSFRTLVAAGMRALENTAPLTEERQWHQFKKLGFVHANLECRKIQARPSWGGTSHPVVAYISAEKVAAQKYCAVCCIPEVILGLNMLHILETVARLDALLHQAKEFLKADNPDITTVGKSLTSLQDARKALAAVLDDHSGIAVKAQQTYQTRFNALWKTSNRQLADIHNTIVAWAVQRICQPGSESSHLGSLEEGSKFPGFEESDLTLFGDGHENTRTKIRDKKLVEMYYAWLTTRQHGVEAAHEAACGVAAWSELVTIDQLCFPNYSPGDGRYLSVTVKQAWEDETRTVLADKLLPFWEKHYVVVLNLTQPTLVGIDSILHDPEIWGLLTGFPSHTTDTYASVRNLLLVPEAIAIWLQTAAHTRAHTQIVTAPLVSPDMLEMISVLWAPRDAESAYKHIADAMAAVVALDVTTKTPLV